MRGIPDVSVAPDRLSTEEEIRQATSADPEMLQHLSRGKLPLCEDWTKLDELESLSAEDLESYLDLLERQSS